jgi:PAS domain S-box-containing protein
MQDLGRFRLHATTVGFGFALAVLAAIAILTYKDISGIRESERWIDHTNQILIKLGALYSELRGAESGTRGYLMSGDVAYLEPYHTAQAELPRLVESLRELISDNPREQRRLNRLEQLIKERYQIFDRGIGGKRAGTRTPDQQRLSSGDGKRIMDEIRAVVAEMETEEHRLLIDRSDEAKASARRAIAVIVAGNCAAFAILISAFGLLRREVSHRTNAEQELRESNRFLDSIFENIPIMVFIKDAADLRIVRYNKAGQSLLGYSQDQLVGKNVYDIFHKEEAEFVTAKDREVLERGTMIDSPEETIHTATGEIRVLHTRKIPIFDDAGKPRYLLGISADVTERRRAAEEIKSLNAGLERRADLLTAANKELEGFSYSVSHDLRAPLRAVDGYSQILAEDYSDRLDDEGRRLLGVVRDSSRKMGTLIDNLLAFSRLGRTPITAVEVDMHALVHDVLRELQANEACKSARFSVADLPVAWGDRAMLRQVWINLLSNAIKFSGNADTQVIAIRGNSNGAESVYSVQDNGVGFDMRYYSKLFGVFQRLHSSDEFTGAGVGLAIVQRVVSRHGGRVWAEGKPNQGATFFFALAQHKQQRG